MKCYDLILLLVKVSLYIVVIFTVFYLFFIYVCILRKKYFRRVKVLLDTSTSLMGNCFFHLWHTFVLLNFTAYPSSFLSSLNLHQGLKIKGIETYLACYLLAPWSRVLLEKLTGFQLVKKFSAFFGTRRFITVLTSARHLSLSCASSIQSTPLHPSS